jgi:hypothetical protein
MGSRPAANPRYLKSGQLASFFWVTFPSILLWYLVLLCFMTSFTNGTFKSSWSVTLGTYHHMWYLWLIFLNYGNIGFATLPFKLLLPFTYFVQRFPCVPVPLSCISSTCIYGPCVFNSSNCNIQNILISSSCRFYVVTYSTCRYFAFSERIILSTYACKTKFQFLLS